MSASRDFNGDGIADILRRNTAGDTTIWFINNSGNVASATSLGTIPTVWSVASTGDFNGDGTGDILWRDTSGDTIWLMSQGSVTSTVSSAHLTIWSVAGSDFKVTAPPTSSARQLRRRDHLDHAERLGDAGHQRR